MSELLAHDGAGSLPAPVVDPKTPLTTKERKEERRKERKIDENNKEREQYGIGLKALFPCPDPKWWLVRTPFS